MRNRGTPANIEHDDEVRALTVERDRYRDALKSIHSVAGDANVEWRPAVESIYAIADKALA